MYNKHKTRFIDASDSEMSDEDIHQKTKSMSIEDSKINNQQNLSFRERSSQTLTGRMINKMAEIFCNPDSRAPPPPLGMDSGTNVDDLSIRPTITSAPTNSNTIGASTSATTILFPSNTSQTDHSNSISNTAQQMHQQVRRNSTGVEPIVSWHPYEQPETTSTTSNEAGSHKTCYCSHTSFPSSESDLSSDSLSIDPSIILDSNVTMAIAKENTHQMRVKTATVIHENRIDDYKMTSKPRGPCLIVNNIDFEGEIFPTRKGSDEDARRFDDIFQQLGFSVIMRRNQTADQMKQLFKDVASGCKEEHDSLFVFILSHGSEHGIYGTDGIEVCLESEIISCFDNKNCKKMLGKPKVFVIQACRGRAKDCGGDGDTTDSVAWSGPVASSPSLKAESLNNRVPASWLPSSQPSEGKVRKHPIRTDMLLVFSCLAGFVSVRNELAGSWLGVALAYFIMTHAHERDLLRILNLVTSDVIQRESSNGHIQSIELKLLGWTKNLYFNPGYYKPRTTQNLQ